MVKKPTHHSASCRFPDLNLVPAGGEEATDGEIVMSITRMTGTLSPMWRDDMVEFI